MVSLSGVHALMVYPKLMAKITGKIPLQKGESVVYQWRDAMGKVYAGQIYGKKVLPNGNIQERITTVYAQKPAMGTNTRVYGPDGTLIKSYYGDIYNNTLRYANDIEGVKKAQCCYNGPRKVLGFNDLKV